MKFMELFTLSNITRPPIRYHGGKFRLAPWIIPQMPPHRVYVDIFGGGAGLLLRKSRSKIEVYNDLESSVVSVFRILRDTEQRANLIQAIALTPFSRDEFKLAYQPTADPIEHARRFIVRTHMGHGTCSMDVNDANGFRSCDIRAGKSYAREWAGVPDALAAAAERFIGVTIENLDYRALIPKFDHSDVFFYADPPYLADTRDAGGKGYVHEMTEHDHRQLAWLLNNIKGKAAISGYPSSLYDQLYKGWRCTQKEHAANGQRGSVPRIEKLWMNY